MAHISFSVKDFDHFVDHSIAGIVALHLLTRYGTRPFSSSKEIHGEKMKMMIHFINVATKDMAQEFDKAVKDNNEIELKDLCGKFSMDTIASCAFGINAKSFKSGSLFVKHAHGI